MNRDDARRDTVEFHIRHWIEIGGFNNWQLYEATSSTSRPRTGRRSTLIRDPALLAQELLAPDSEAAWRRDVLESGKST